LHLFTRNAQLLTPLALLFPILTINPEAGSRRICEQNTAARFPACPSTPPEERKDGSTPGSNNYLRRTQAMIPRRSRPKFLLAACLLALLVVTTSWLYDPLPTGEHAHGVHTASASDDRVEFDVVDDPAIWFRNRAGPVGGTESLAVVNPGAEVKFRGDSNTVHTVTSLLWPTGAEGMPFETDPMKGSVEVDLETPGLYVFFCQIHPYMFAAVINDDPATPGLDLGENITLHNGITVPTSSDLATRLLRTFFIATNPDNWQDYTSAAPWHVTYPDVDVRITGGAVVNLPEVLDARYGNDLTLDALRNPAAPGVGEVWVDTQFELTADKDKPGTATALTAGDWLIRRKVALPGIDMNNPHNMWTDRDQTLIYQTQWFDSKLTVFNRDTGRLVRNISVGEAPAHVMTRVDTDEVHVTLNGAENTDSVVELSPGARNVERRIDIGRGEPHAHWMSHDGQTMVTPNVFDSDSTIFDFGRNRITAIVPAGSHPIAAGMMPDASKVYVANFLDSTISVLRTSTGELLGTINLLQNYDPISGQITGPVGGLPIQTPVSPNGKYMVTANTLTATILIIDTATDTIAKMLPCDPGCHGVQFGAKQGGGYYAYVSSKFSNRLLVVDPDPNGDGDAADAAIAGTVSLVAGPGTPATTRSSAMPGWAARASCPYPLSTMAGYRICRPHGKPS
jgi:DNA-binding beta-propeller fold protein YncE